MRSPQPSAVSYQPNHQRQHERLADKATSLRARLAYARAHSSRQTQEAIRRRLVEVLHQRRRLAAHHPQDWNN